MDVSQQLTDIFDNIADLAEGLQKKVSYLVIAGLLSSIYIAWLLYSPQSALWWNLFKCVLIMLPAIVWSFIWLVLGQLQQAPELVSKMASQDIDSQDINLSSKLQTHKLDKAEGFRGLLSTVQTFKQEEGFEVILDTISGVTMLANPLFLAIAIFMIIILLLLILVTPLILIF